MPVSYIPCFAGPLDGQFRPVENSSPPAGYRKYPIRGRHTYLYNHVKVERLDFDILSKAAKVFPDSGEDLYNED